MEATANNLMKIYLKHGKSALILLSIVKKIVTFTSFVPVIQEYVPNWQFPNGG